jgi:hypothetical protein
MIYEFWRLSEAKTEDNLGLSCTDQGLILGGTPLIERRNGRFVVRNQDELAVFSSLRRARLTSIASRSALPSVARALNANDQGLARIAAVHLQMPDLPNHAARRRMEAEDILIKSVDWNPDLHPRTGTPPNSGWFASTDDAQEEHSRTRAAQNENPEARSDAPQLIPIKRATLPPGRRNDELGDLFEWIANAKPMDEKKIRAEIDRYYANAGDTSASDALNTALTDALEPGIKYKDRQDILSSIGPYAHSDVFDDETTANLIGAGLLLLSMLPPIAAVEAPAAVWELGWAARGIYLSDRFGANLPAKFPVIDRWLNNIATSIKSIDLRAATYQDALRLSSRVDEYVNKMIFYQGGKMADIEVNGRHRNQCVSHHRQRVDRGDSQRKCNGRSRENT